MNTHVVIIGAGPAGLTAAYLLSQQHIAVTVLEADPQYVGGIAKTVTYKGYCFDIGGHRFFSKSKEIEDLWSEMLPHDMLNRPRSSRIYYRARFFSYPLKAFEALYKLGFLESIRCLLSYVRAKLFPISPVASFSDWVTNHFGHRLFSIFFKTYTEKVWGMPCQEISADWAQQRIKGLSLFSAIFNAFIPTLFLSKKATIKTLIGTFRYPRKGPGMLWEACNDKVKRMGGNVILGASLTHCEHVNGEHWQITYADSDGLSHTLTATHLISSAPLRNLVTHYLKNKVSAKTIAAANSLSYRDFLIVVLILKDRQAFSDNWIYVHDDKVDVARIQNFKSWSPDMVPDPTMCCYGMEYFYSSHDVLHTMTDEALLTKAKKELIQLKLGREEDIVDGCVLRQPKAYPVYDNHYQEHVDTIKKELEETFPTLYLIGRNGMHKYNNQDHAMMTAMLTVKNILHGSRLHNVWCVNQDAEYIEEGRAGEKNMEEGLREVPKRI